MGVEEPKDPLKGVDWKSIGGAAHKDPSGGPVTKKRLPKKIRQIPECYFLPRRSLPSTIALYGTIIAAGVGAGMLLEKWIDKKVKGCPNELRDLRKRDHVSPHVYIAGFVGKPDEFFCSRFFDDINIEKFAYVCQIQL
ncbi:hypothetical protein L1049_013836 [Liquidambar formosana]|uniref:Uncharacterized protein n=1 Tax=Liquidambar formosana TaxID=63359 RepID=A0AAP0WUE4_LIQFO